MNAPPFPPNPSFGQYFGNWVWSGSRWVCTNTNGVRVVTQVFRASAPYMPSPGLISCVVETIGGGGAGGPAISPGVLWLLSGGGGGSGGYSRIALASGLVLGGVNVIVGAGGQQGPGAGTPSAGGATSFGAFCVANGGQPGVGNDAQAGGWGQGGGPAPPGVGDIALPGSCGSNGIFLVFPTAVDYNGSGGANGGAMWGGNVAGVETGVGGFISGSDGLPNTGAGGGSACVNQAAASAIAYGGAGGSGICIVTEYCWADAIDDGCGCGPTSGQARVAITGPQAGWPGGFDND
jgi:hypothetical protein